MVHLEWRLKWYSLLIVISFLFLCPRIKQHLHARKRNLKNGIYVCLSIKFCIGAGRKVRFKKKNDDQSFSEEIWNETGPIAHCFSPNPFIHPIQCLSNPFRESVAVSTAHTSQPAKRPLSLFLSLFLSRFY